MKLSSELRNLPVVSITEGEEIGVVKDFIVDPAAKAIVAMIIEDSTWYQGAKALMFSLIHSIGNSAITTESSASVVDLSSMPELTDLLKRNIAIYDSKVLTRGGRNIGRVGEFSIDKHSGQILGLELKEKDAGIGAPEFSVVPTSCVVTIGKSVTIVEEDVEDHMTASHPSDGSGAAAPRPAPRPAPKPAAPAPKPAAPPPPPPKHDFSEAANIADRVDETIHESEAEDLEDLDFDSVLDSIQEDLPAEEGPEDEVDLGGGGDDLDLGGQIDLGGGSAAPVEIGGPGDGDKKENLAEIFERRQIKYMLNKKVSKDIETDDGDAVISKGDVITEAAIQKAKAAGKFLELSMNIEVED